MRARNFTGAPINRTAEADTGGKEFHLRQEFGQYGLNLLSNPGSATTGFDGKLASLENGA
jgi:hypothetical protein